MIDVYLETGAKRTFAGALDWPGWSRSGRDAEASLAALFAYGRRYAAAIASARLGFRAPRVASELVVAERIPGGATTDFGAPGETPAVDREPLGDRELRRLERVLAACWRSFDRAAEGARGRELRKGPRGGGRQLDAIVRHVADADRAYVRALGTGVPVPSDEAVALAPMRDVVAEALRIAPRDEPDRRGPRGGRLWTPRYAVRRIAWHVLDHAWEIEDRTPAA